MKWTVGRKLTGGFSLVGLIIIVIVVLVYTKLQDAENLSTRISQLRAPTAQASMKVLNGINYSLASLRGWMLLGTEKSKTDRAAYCSRWWKSSFRQTSGKRR